MTISEISKAVEGRRDEMKNLSKHMNSLIDKLLPKTIGQANRPHFRPEFESSECKKLHSSLESVYQQIQKAKHEIELHKEGEPVGLTQE